VLVDTDIDHSTCKVEEAGGGQSEDRSNRTQLTDKLIDKCLISLLVLGPCAPIR